MMVREMQRGRVVHGAFLRCRDRNVKIDLSTLMVSLIMERRKRIF